MFAFRITILTGNNYIPLPNYHYVSELNKRQENNTDSIIAF